MLDILFHRVCILHSINASSTATPLCSEVQDPRLDWVTSVVAAATEEKKVTDTLRRMTWTFFPHLLPPKSPVVHASSPPFSGRSFLNLPF